MPSDASRSSIALRGPDARYGTGAGASSPFPAFRPRLPWLGADLQTLRDVLVPGRDPHAPASTRILEFPMPDDTGDRLSGILEQPRSPAGQPLALLVHGLTGCADSRYVRRAAGRLLAAGFSVLRLNLRGAGPCRATCRQQYHSGRSQDLDAVLAQLPAELSADGLVLAGWSLGANMLLKGLAEFGERYPIRAAVAVSAPIHLAAAAARLGHARNRAYHGWLLARMKAEALAAPGPLSDAARHMLARIRRIAEFDDAFTAPDNGFADAADYYARCSAIRFLPSITVPTLVIHALDDPWIPGDVYRAYDWAGNPRLTPLLPRHGGHVGFHAPGGRVWSDDCMMTYLERLLQDGAQPALSRWATSTAK